METQSDELTLDFRQREVRDFFVDQSGFSEIISARRWFQDSENRILEPKRTAMASRNAELLREAKATFDAISDSLPSISTAKGKVHRDHAPLYLAQEVQREHYRDVIHQWYLTYHDHRSKIDEAQKCEHSYHMPEREMCADSIEKLGTQLSDLDADQTLRRACFILGEIERERQYLQWKFWTAPINSIQSAGLSVVSTAVLMGHWFAGIAGVGSTGCQYAYEFFRSRNRQASLSVTEKNCLHLIRDEVEKNRGLLICYLAEAGIQTDPDSLVEKLRQK